MWISANTIADNKNNKNGNGKHWTDLCHHTPFRGRTEDPEALAFDDAYALFREGLRLSREGHLEEGRQALAGAFLWDERSIQGIDRLPPNKDKNKNGEAKEAPPSYSLLDLKLLQTLASYKSPQMTTVSQKAAPLTLMLMLTKSMAQQQQNQQDSELVRAVLMEGLGSIDALIALLEEDPSLEGNSECCQGQLYRTRLFLQRASLHVALGKPKKAREDLNQALQTDASCTQARFQRALLSAQYEWEPTTTIYQNLKRVLEESHPDGTRNPVVLAYLAILGLINPLLATYEQAFDFYRASKCATQRQKQIYGDSNGNDDGDNEEDCLNLSTAIATTTTSREHEQSILELMYRLFQPCQRDPKLKQRRQEADGQVEQGNPRVIAFLENMHMHDVDPKQQKRATMDRQQQQQQQQQQYQQQRKQKRQQQQQLGQEQRCLKCHHPTINCDTPVSCKRCYTVHYCCPQCQVDDWQQHKRFCGKVKSPRIPKNSNNNRWKDIPLPSPGLEHRQPVMLWQRQSSW